MSSVSALVILVTVLVSAFISGIFGMAGGLILMGNVGADPEAYVLSLPMLHGQPMLALVRALS